MNQTAARVARAWAFVFFWILALALLSPPFSEAFGNPGGISNVSFGTQPLGPASGSAIPVALLLSGYDLETMFSGDGSASLIEHFIRPLTHEGYNVTTFICVVDVNDPGLMGDVNKLRNPPPSLALRMTHSREQTSLALRNVTAQLNIQIAQNNTPGYDQFTRLESCLDYALELEQEHGMEFQFFVRSRPDFKWFSNFSLKILNPSLVTVQTLSVAYARPTNVSAQTFSMSYLGCSPPPYNRKKLIALGLPWCAQLNDQVAVVPRRHLRVLQVSRPCVDLHNYSAMHAVCPFFTGEPEYTWTRHLLACTNGTRFVDIRAFPGSLVPSGSLRDPKKRQWRKVLNMKAAVENKTFLC
jgi:hypothetical protein